MSLYAGDIGSKIMSGEIKSEDLKFKPVNIQKPVQTNFNQQQALLDAQLQLAQQQALMQEMSQTSYSGITDKVFGKQEGWSFERPMRLGAYIILGAVVGRYVAKNMKKSSTLGMIVGGLAPLLAYQLSIAYDRKNMPKQEPRQKVAINPDGSIMTEKQIVNTHIRTPGLGFNLNCPNGTKKIQPNCITAPCPERTVCA